MPAPRAAFVGGPLHTSLTAARPGRPAARARARPRPAPRMSGAPAREPWPARRFLRTLLWYSPLGRAVRGRPLAAAAAAAVAPAAAPAAAPARAAMTVLVTGAAGATGRRVVRELLRDGSRVKALVRDRERGVAALARAGVAVAEEARLELVVSDLYNLPAELFAGVTAVVSCTGTRVGPAGDTPDRALYLQGIQFYEPTILDDTPENVEWFGVRALADGAAAQFAAAAAAAVAGGARGERALVPVLTHEDSPQFRATWGTLDDVVMGGVSESSVAAVGGQLVFAGATSVRNSGGFASARTVNFAVPLDLSACDGVRLSVLGDGNRYKFILRCDERWDGVAHCHSFDTVAGQWLDLDVPWTAFNTVFRADTLPDGAPVDAGRICALQIMLSKFEYDRALNPRFTPGPFELRLGTISGYKSSAAAGSVAAGSAAAGSAAAAVYPKFVHVGSAGTTRYFRKGEFSAEDLPPAVKMNDELGRIMEWKLAGEDAVRAALAGAGYVIVRPCALTEKPAVGLDALALEQGDNMTGQIGRDDLARLLVEALYRPVANVTFEVAEAPRGRAPQRLDSVALAPDSPERTFASYPFRPQ